MCGGVAAIQCPSGRSVFFLSKHRSRVNIQPVVEGHGEVEAVPVLLRRLRDEAGAWTVEIERPIRRPRSQLTSELGIGRAVEIARRQPACEAILIVFDGDQDCPAELGPKVQGWATAAARGLPCEVALPHREYEAWFLATIESLRTHPRSLIKTDAASHPDPEKPLDAKGQMRERMTRGIAYSPTAHQARLSGRFSLELAYRRSRSFRKLATSFGSLLEAMGQDIGAWPPEHWSR